ncbi:hypothetical protein [Streptomyces cellostaticus]|uniref:hypothetical protein n=1 Tax=Streptomyces cellostaticus TaxID=67285 RepID=UPI000B0EDDCA|nr:hypothetical protein [Streptomyces cellostaticus]GHI10048.1 hypothetical protein Scel_83690 [Streptomyces cellostaticus]
MTGTPLARHAERPDLPRVAELAALHAEYERAVPRTHDGLLPGLLREADLFRFDRRLCM